MILREALRAALLNVPWDGCAAGSAGQPDLIFDYETALPHHANGIGFFALDADGKTLLANETADEIFLDKRQRADNRNQSVEKGLGGNHGAYFAGKTDIHEKRFNDIVFVVAERHLAAVQFVGDFKEAFAAQACAEKTGVFAVFSAMGDASEIGLGDPQVQSHITALGA